MISTKLDTKRIDRILQQLETKAGNLVDKTAFDVQGRAQNLAPVDTSALKNSIYTVTKHSDGLNIEAKAKVVAIPRPTEDLVAHVGPSVEYAIYQELGTSRMPAHPFLVPAIESLRKTWRASWKALFRELK